MRSLCLAVLACLSLTFPLSAVTCGETLGPVGIYTLTADLTCDSEIALTVIDGAVLDLAGFTVTGLVKSVLLEGTGATVGNGTVVSAGLPAVAIQLVGTGGHRVQAVTIESRSYGVIVFSERNVITDCMMRGQILVDVRGDRNLVQRNVLIGEMPVFVDGDENVIWANLSQLHLDGIYIFGHRNWVLKNTIGQDGHAGVAAMTIINGTENVLWRNTVLGGNETDLVDQWGHCRHNRWIANQAATSDPPCILEEPLAVSQAR